MKGAVYPEDALVLWASRRCGGRPVKWVSTRSEAFLGDSHGRDQVVTGELALDEHGKVLGLRVDALHDMGSHVFDAGVVVVLFALKLAPGGYQMPAVLAAGRAVLTNTPPLQPYRGAGRPEATYLIELLLDRAAHVLGIDPIEIRRRNFVPPSAMPHALHSGIAFDSGEFMRVMDECLKLADWNGFAKRAAESKKNGMLRGRGIGYFIEEAAIFNDRMTIRFDPSGTLMILAGTQRAQKGGRRHRREGEADGGDDAGGGRKRPRIQRRQLSHRRYRPLAAASGGGAVAASADVPAAAIRSRAGGLGHVRRRAVELPQRLSS